MYTQAINMRTSVRMIQMCYSDVVSDDLASSLKAISIEPFYGTGGLFHRYEFGFISTAIIRLGHTLKSQSVLDGCG